MKITPTILSIPPYLSTTWTHIRALYMKDERLVVSLLDGVNIAIPNLSEEELKNIFAAHAVFAEYQHRKTQPPEKQTPVHLFHAGTIPDGEQAGSVRFSFDNMESLGSALQHNPAQAHLPDLPPDILNKIASIAKIVAPGEIQNLPKAEPHCNCPHCQIARAIHGTTHPSVAEQTIEDEVSDKDLSFQQWSILQVSDNLFSVTNKLDTLEKYNVFLGDPVGCTCGKAGCEHILAVLKS